MTGKFRADEATEWNSRGNMGRGKIRKKLATRTLLKGHAVATEDHRDDSRDERRDERRAPEPGARDDTDRASPPRGPGARPGA